LPNRNLVLVVDDDPAMLRSVARLLWQFGYASLLFPSAEAFTNHSDFGGVACVILDINLGDGSGIELRQRLKATNISVPLRTSTWPTDVAAASRRSADDDFNITRSLPGASGDCVVACDSDRNAAKRISENASAPVTHLTHDALRESVFINPSNFISRTSPRIRAPVCDRAAHRRRLRPEHARSAQA